MSKLPELESYLSPSALFILRVLIGVVLGLLTVYRRDLSSNREYHTDGDALDTRCEETISRSQSTTADKWGECSPGESKGNLRRRASSSSLPSLCNTPPRAPKHIRRSDPTEELLESAGFVFSGGPFLAVMLAVVDHLMLTVFLTSVASVSTLMWRRKDVPGQTDDSSRESEQEEDKISPQMNQSVHQVALNAATEYFNDISSKLEKENSTELSTQVLFNKPKRSRSVNNISQISEEECLDLITLARGHLDISLLPSETQISIFSFLHPKDLLQYTCTNKKGMRMLTDAVDSILTGEEENNIIHNRHHAVSERNTAMLIWKELFQRDYAWILREWKIGQEALQRSLDVLTWDGFDSTDTPATLNYHTPTVLQHILSTTGIENNLNEEIIMRHPLTSMKEFYFTFAETWLNYTIAGCNSTEKCLIGLHGHVFDISNFVEQHPGSTETLLLQAGRDATVFFETMGHSLGARRLALSMCAVINGQCLSWEAEHVVANTKAHSSWGLIRPSCPAVQSRKLQPGFIIPRKRSKPRKSGGLFRIRNKLKREAITELTKADRWGHSILGIGNLFGGVQVYFDPICCKWRWWYTDLNFDPVYTESVL